MVNSLAISRYLVEEKQVAENLYDKIKERREQQRQVLGGTLHGVHFFGLDEEKVAKVLSVYDIQLNKNSYRYFTESYTPSGSLINTTFLDATFFLASDTVFLGRAMRQFKKEDREKYERYRALGGLQEHEIIQTARKKVAVYVGNRDRFQKDCGFVNEDWKTATQIKSHDSHIDWNPSISSLERLMVAAYSVGASIIHVTPSFSKDSFESGVAFKPKK
jgi:hypothetical protein